MDKLIIKATSKSLKVQCDPEKGLIEIEGCSITNDPRVFFKPIQNWVSDYLKNPSPETVINIKFEYIDSASTKFIFEILRSLDQLVDEQKSIHLNWHYDDNDPEILEVGEILAGRLKIPFNYIQS